MSGKIAAQYDLTHYLTRLAETQFFCFCYKVCSSPSQQVSSLHSLPRFDGFLKYSVPTKNSGILIVAIKILHVGCSHSVDSQHFMEPEGSLPLS
jgi:hypothetical protein